MREKGLSGLFLPRLVPESPFGFPFLKLWKAYLFQMLMSAATGLWKIPGGRARRQNGVDCAVSAPIRAEFQAESGR